MTEEICEQVVPQAERTSEAASSTYKPATAKSVNSWYKGQMQRRELKKFAQSTIKDQISAMLTAPSVSVVASEALVSEATQAEHEIVSGVQEVGASAQEAVNQPVGVDEALDALIKIVGVVMALLARHSVEAFEASHALIFSAYRFMKSRERDPERHERVLCDAGIKPRKNRSLPKRCLRLALMRAGYAKPNSTEHDWADWVWVMDEDGVAVTLEAVTTYRTEWAVVSEKRVKGTDRLDARREELRAEDRAKKRAAEQQRAAEEERETATAILQGLSKQFVQMEWDGDSEDYTAGLDLLVLKDGAPAGLLKASEGERSKIVAKYGLR